MAFTGVSNSNKGSTDYKRHLRFGDSNKISSFEDNENLKKHKGSFSNTTPQYQLLYFPYNLDLKNCVRPKNLKYMHRNLRISNICIYWDSGTGNKKKYITQNNSKIQNVSAH